MLWHSPKDAMPWVGLYISGVSLFCTLAMAADAFQGFRQWRLWFPCRFFTINAVSITLIAIAMKLPVDLTTEMPQYGDLVTKYVSFFFLLTMVGNFLPSLGLMGDKQLLTNIIAFGILLITITVNVLIQSFTGAAYNLIETIMFLIFPILLLFSVALIVPTFRRILEHQYKELHELDSASQQVNFSYKELIHNVKKSWMMTETGNPQFVIACSPVSYVFGTMCFLNAIQSFVLLYRVYENWDSGSDYEWSMIVILVVQALGNVLGSIAPIFRCFSAINHFNISKRWSVNHLNVFKVEKYWTQKLQQWKHIHVRPRIPGRHLKIVFNSFKNLFLSFCIALQITLVILCKTMALAPKCFIILLSCCCSLCMLSFKTCKEPKNASDSNVRADIKEYSVYVLRFQKESQLSERILRNTLNSITKLIHQSEKKEPSDLMKLLKKSIGFNGALEFDNDQVPPLYSEKKQNSWSLVVVTLTGIAIALPNIANSHVKELLASIREGLKFVRHVEENLNANIDDLIKARQTSRRVWTEVEVYRKWLQIDLQYNALKGKTSKETLQCLADEAVQVVIKFKNRKNGGLDHSMHKFLAASSMYRISETILSHCNEQETWPKDQELFDWISTLVADILCACFTNLPRVIKMKCHHDAIEKREDGIRAAAQLLGRSKKILKILKPRKLPDIDPDSMAYIDKWRASHKCQIPNGGALSVGIHQGRSSSSNESHSITIL